MLTSWAAKTLLSTALPSLRLMRAPTPMESTSEDQMELILPIQLSEPVMIVSQLAMAASKYQSRKLAADLAMVLVWEV